MSRPDSDVEMNVRDETNEEVKVDIVPAHNEAQPQAAAASAVPVDQNTAALTVGSLGHVFRRVYHILVFTSVSYLYYFHGIDG